MLCAAAAPLAAAQPELARFFDEFLLEWMRADPESATASRIFPPSEQEQLDAKLSDDSDAGRRRRIAQARAGLARLAKFDRAALSPADRLSADLFEWSLRDVIDEEPFLDTRFPLNQMRGVQNSLPTLLTDVHPLRNRRDAENYIARLEAAAPKIDIAVAEMRDRDKRGIRPPKFILDETASQMRRFTAPEPARNILVTSFTERLKLLSSIEPAASTRMTASVQKLVAESIYPAYRRASDALSTISTRATADAGLSRLPRGEEAYAFYLRRFTTTSLGAAEIHRIGLDEVARIEREMDVLLRKLNYTEGNVTERVRKLEADQYYPDTPDARDKVLADYARMIADAERRSADAFDRRPRARCIVQRIPEFQEANAAANYGRPPADGSRPGIFRVPLRGPRFSRVGMRTLAHHEAIPGHHFQIALQVEMTELPQFRRSSPFGPLSAFSEGWALYAERLVAELGWYRDDAVSDIGRLNGELFRARRLVVDTGLHSKRWTREQAIEYGIQKSEVERYVVMPGQACSYKIGQMKILELRDKAKRRMGARFSLPRFHNAVLGNGSIPLSLLERVVDAWTEEKA
jgi:uncharacterized protein (DUF885 family)